MSSGAGAGLHGCDPNPTRKDPLRDLVVTQNLPVDGVIDLAEGWFSPDDAGDADRADLAAALTEQRDAADAFLTGRTTFEQMRSYWPHQTDDPTGVSDYLNRVSKYVVSTTMEDPAWDRTTVLRGPLSVDIGALKAAPGADIVVTGSITLVRDLIAGGLVDEYRLFVYPVVVGRGARLFADATGVPRLRLLETRAFRSGVVLLRYRPA
jgi:dihydrofolate reductase